MMLEKAVENQVEPGEGVPDGGVTGAGPKKGIKSVRWDRDPEILLRLERVSIMMVQGASLRQIAKTMNYSHNTAKKDIARVYDLWKREATESVDKQRLLSVAKLLHVQAELWAVWRVMTADERKKFVKHLDLIADIETQIMELQGTKSPSILELHKVTDPREMSDAELAAIVAAGSDAGGSRG